MNASTWDGGCLCREIRFRVSGEARNRCYCHCRSCRLASGAPFVAWATFPADGLRVLQGSLAEHRSSEHVSRGFCPRCSTAITYRHDARPGELDVAVATLDDASAVAPQAHIWVSDKPSWVVIGDGLPQHARWRKDAT